jgi:hypothetical protein
VQLPVPGSCIIRVSQRLTITVLVLDVRSNAFFAVSVWGYSKNQLSFASTFQFDHRHQSCCSIATGLKKLCYTGQSFTGVSFNVFQSTGVNSGCHYIQHSLNCLQPPTSACLSPHVVYAFPTSSIQCNFVPWWKVLPFIQSINVFPKCIVDVTDIFCSSWVNHSYLLHIK